MSIFNQWGKAADRWGTALNLPELGVSEALGYNPPSGTFGDSTYQQYPATNTNFIGPVQQANKSTQSVQPTQATQSAGNFQSPPVQQGPTPEQIAQQQYEAQVRGEIESGYGNYFAQLDSILNEGLPGQRTAQEGIASSQQQAGLNTLGMQRTEGMSDLQGQRDLTQSTQASNLKDLASNLRNMFMAGNVYLGARGAGDSSAANQYSYALQKLGNKARGDVLSQSSDIMAEIGQRETKLTNLYNTEVKNLEETTSQKMMQIASWFGEQQNSLKQAQAQGQLSKGQDLASLSQNMLSQAMSQLSMIEQEASNRRTALDQWALNNSNSISEASANLQAVGTFNPAQPQSKTITGTPQVDAAGNLRAATGYGQSDEDKRLA